MHFIEPFFLGKRFKRDRGERYENLDTSNQLPKDQRHHRRAAANPTNNDQQTIHQQSKSQTIDQHTTAEHRINTSAHPVTRDGELMKFVKEWIKLTLCNLRVIIFSKFLESDNLFFQNF